MNTQCWGDGITGTFTREGDTTQHVVTILVGIGHQTQLLIAGHHVLLTLSSHLGRCMVTIGHTVLLTEVVGNSLVLKSLVERIVHLQAFFRAIQGVVVILLYLLCRQSTVEETELVDITFEMLGEIERARVGYGNIVYFFGLAPVDSISIARLTLFEYGLFIIVPGHKYLGHLATMCHCDVAPLIGRDVGIRRTVTGTTIYVGTNLIDLRTTVILQIDTEGIFYINEQILTTVDGHLRVIGVYPQLIGEGALHQLTQIDRVHDAVHTCT